MLRASMHPRLRRGEAKPSPRRARQGMKRLRTVSASRMLSSFSFQRLPVVSNKRAARRRVHAPQLSEEFGRLPRRAMVQGSGDQARAVTRVIVDRRERTPCASENTGPDSVGLLRPRGLNLAVLADCPPSPSAL